MKIMRALLSILCCLSLGACSRSGGDESGLVVHLPPNPTAAERAFAAALTQAFAQKDPAQFVRLTHWRTSEDAPIFLSEQYVALIKRGCQSITIARADPKLATERIEQDTKVRESLPVSWTVDIKHPASYELHTDLNAGLDGDTIKLTSAYVVKD